MDKRVLVGTRGSKLAKWQAQLVVDKLQANFDGYSFRLVEIKTKGDIYKNKEFKDLGGGKGIFTGELDDALKRTEIDIAVHSLKDVPYKFPPEIKLGAVVCRTDPSDVLISHGNLSLEELPQGAIIGSSSLRRKAQLLYFRPDLSVVPFRGNINTRLDKVKRKEVDAAVMAAAGLERLGLDEMITEYLPYSLCMPGAGQGAVGITVREDKKDIQDLIHKINDPIAANAVTAERTVVEYLNGACNTPIGAFACCKGKRIQLEAVVASLEGENVVYAYGTGFSSDPQMLGKAVSEKLINKGADKILTRIKEEGGN